MHETSEESKRLQTVLACIDKIAHQIPQRDKLLKYLRLEGGAVELSCAVRC